MEAERLAERRRELNVDEGEVWVGFFGRAIYEGAVKDIDRLLMSFLIGRSMEVLVGISIVLVGVLRKVLTSVFMRY